MTSSAGCAKEDVSQGENPPIPAPQGANWVLVFDADFDGNSWDATQFTPCFDWNAGDCTSSFNDGREHYLPEQVRVRDGIANLVAEPLTPPYRDDECFEGICNYKSGMLSTARPDMSSPYLYEFTYGYVEARLKLPNTTGISSGFWMLPTNPDFQYDYELDIVEHLGGKPDVVYQTYQYNDRQNFFKVNDIVQDTNGMCPKLDYSEAFHTYGVNWQPDHIAFYIDGQECGRFTATQPQQIVSEPMQIILNLGVDNDWPRAAHLTLASQSATDRLEVDYVKVWQAQ